MRRVVARGPRPRSIAALVLAACPFAASAHGGLAMEADQCKLTVGRYLMHFAGYQEDAQRTEFCEDIPHAGPTIIVLDFVDAALRDMPVEVVVVRRHDGPPEKGPVVYTLPPQQYPRGTLTLRHDFKEGGDYIGLVYAGTNRQHAAVFPFAVGRDRTTPLLLAGAAGLAVLGVGGWVFARRRLGRDIEQAAARAPT